MTRKIGDDVKPASDTLSSVSMEVAIGNLRGLSGKSVLVTGGTGSFGRGLVDFLTSHFSPERLIVFSRDELKQFEMQQKWKQPCMRYFIGDVRDVDRLEMAMRGVDYVIHAAALKQVHDRGIQSVRMHPHQRSWRGKCRTAATTLRREARHRAVDRQGRQSDQSLRRRASSRPTRSSSPPTIWRAGSARALRSCATATSSARAAARSRCSIG